jgi:hypothetical protein
MPFGSVLYDSKEDVGIADDIERCSFANWRGNRDSENRDCDLIGLGCVAVEGPLLSIRAALMVLNLVNIDRDDRTAPRKAGMSADMGAQNKKGQ